MIYGMTGPRRRALAVLRKIGRASVSNMTSALRRCVYWQTARWLVSESLAEITRTRTVVLTAIGEQVADEVTGAVPAC